MATYLQPSWDEGEKHPKLGKEAVGAVSIAAGQGKVSSSLAALLCTAPCQGAQDSSGAWLKLPGLCTHLGKHGWGSWLLLIVAIWGGNYRAEDMGISLLSLSLHKCTLPITITSFRREEKKKERKKKKATRRLTVRIAGTGRCLSPQPTPAG